MIALKNVHQSQTTPVDTEVSCFNFFIWSNWGQNCGRKQFEAVISGTNFAGSHHNHPVDMYEMTPLGLRNQSALDIARSILRTPELVSRTADDSLHELHLIYRVWGTGEPCGLIYLEIISVRDPSLPPFLSLFYFIFCSSCQASASNPFRSGGGGFFLENSFYPKNDKARRR